MQEEGALCQVCWQGHMELQEGMLVCDVCGSVDQVIECIWCERLSWHRLSLTEGEVLRGQSDCDIIQAFLTPQGFTQLTEEFEGGPSQRTTQR